MLKLCKQIKRINDTIFRVLSFFLFTLLTRTVQNVIIFPTNAVSSSGVNPNMPLLSEVQCFGTNSTRCHKFCCRHHEKLSYYRKNILSVVLPLHVYTLQVL